ncbi:hypothetical protein LP123_08185 [Moraxella bovis]|uniref:hypothetical protein n=1 Tax=Moraxella bovis TaxID=476 RepID=UPI000991CFB1|nr:hypothetical protein [Moraxella bovis]OOR87564.1 hypothetical protein B0182_11950 [Moraxella bovis]UYZ82320.1 hypothetical protein LP113_06400 [Moraxella bovis]UZA07341.1 hypothetical protein LP099_06100 [Moraxella bovis]UZA10423.1 hypothetical protein LP123_08185 [Moraxella bovis]UZA17816.1 hypothetical protein LP109_05930 [Moraxella bovis]
MSIKSYSCIPSIFFALGLTACNQTAPTDNAPTAKADGQAEAFVGCYSVEKNSPAQIKVSEQAGGFFMQMKEPDGAKTLWDNPEPLDEISVDEAWDYFGVNALSLDKSDVERVLARPDEMMVLAKIKDASQNINPLLDSPYVVYIFKGANTIYQVPCDDTPVDIVKNGKKTVQAFYQ